MYEAAAAAVQAWGRHIATVAARRRDDALREAEADAEAEADGAATKAETPGFDTTEEEGLEAEDEEDAPAAADEYAAAAADLGPAAATPSSDEDAEPQQDAEAEQPLASLSLILPELQPIPSQPSTSCATQPLPAVASSNNDDDLGSELFDDAIFAADLVADATA